MSAKKKTPRDRKMSKLIEDIKADRFDLEARPIRFDKTGSLIDGQYRHLAKRR